ncbi:MAG: hypothetical protein JW910_04955, partial [Anaerolineae bacterium]|nr:hypothetical protein [Anaerolineae bacterium]
VLVNAGCTGAPDATPTPTTTPVPTDSPTPLPSDTPRPTPTDTPTPRPTGTPLPSLTPTGQDAPPPSATPLANQPVVEEGVPPPYDITLPEGWRAGYSVLPMRGTVIDGEIPLAIYTGPLADLQDVNAWIVVLWAFPSMSLDGTPDLWADGLRFLRASLLDPSCNIGTDQARSFSVGGYDDAVGTYWQAIACQGEPDAGGWFAGLTEQGGNFVFFVGVEPPPSRDAAIPVLQGILDSITWHVIPTITPGAPADD